MAVAAVAAVSLLGITGTAGAAGSPVTHVRSNMAFADASGYRESGDHSWASSVTASRSLSRSGSELHLWKAEGTMGGSTTSINADVTRGFTFTIDARHLSSASLSATGLPATRCTYDENGELVGQCTDTTVDVNITWSGQGAISKGSYTEHVTIGGSVTKVHGSWTSRDARATGSLNGALRPADFESADLRTEKQVKMGR
jgi:hypothetical protein